jgi:hypothetical protein
MGSVETWDTYLDVEPYTGKVLRGSKKAQLNAEIGAPWLWHPGGMFPDPNGEPYRFVAHTILPVFWFEYGAEMNDGQHGLVSDAVSKLSLATVAQKVFLYVGGAGGFLLLCVAFYLVYSYWNRPAQARASDEPTRGMSTQYQNLAYPAAEHKESA